MESSSHNHAQSHLQQVVHHLAHLLPAQGPIGVFIHHNTLHGMQNLPFEEAVVEAARTYQAEPYLTEQAFRQRFAQGAIRLQDLEAVVAAEGVDQELRLVLLYPGIREFHPETIRWQLEHEGLGERFREDLPAAARLLLQKEEPQRLFQWILEQTEVPEQPAQVAVRPRDGILARLGVDTDEAVHPLLIKLTASFLDQGLAYWPMPKREQGLWPCALALLQQPMTVPSAQGKQLRKWANHMRHLSAEAAIREALQQLFIPEAECEPFLRAELLALPGWSGMVATLESDPSLAPHERLPVSLLDLLALRLLLTLSAVESTLGSLQGWQVAMPPAEDAEAVRLTEAATLFDAAQLMGYTTGQLRQWTDATGADEKGLEKGTGSRWQAFVASVRACNGWERRRLWQLALERRHERQILLPLQQHAKSLPAQQQERVAAQLIFCIDDREESIRRHLEEVDPQVETFGAAGFFGVAMDYAGIDDARGAALCPVVVKPAHRVLERPAAGHEEQEGRRQSLRRFWAWLTREWFISSRSLVRGWLGISALGLFSLFPMVARVLSPRRYARVMQWLNDSILPDPRTELAFMREGQASHEAAEGLMHGFTTEEKVERLAGVLAPAGLRRDFARLVLVLGHGSTSLNNPHESAYDCGACGGRRGGPNARIFAAMANLPAVRQGLKQKGIFIPEDTWFIGGYHDTCNCQIDLYDLEELPATHALDLDRLQASLDEARARSAQERTRRFAHAEEYATPQAALHHVQDRAEHLAEPRPEYGHSSNAVAIVGRRQTTKGLFLDRRSFLISYDALQDPAGQNLARLLGAVVPVCAGINLEYYFSTVDNEKYGCGTKLPHNITGLIGVMNGAESDLRTGLTLQMVEIHEPVRILFVVEAAPDMIVATMHANPLLREFLENRWIRLAAQSPVDGSLLHAYRGGGVWEPISGLDEMLQHAPDSLSWYWGKRHHLPIARVGQAGARQIAKVGQ